jgi:glycosyltransferase involved in cell wall biosynthesis
VIPTGFVVSSEEGWLGGLSYFRNLLTALYSLPERQIDAVIITGTRAQKKYFDGFPDIKIVRSRLFDRGSLPWMLRKIWLRWVPRDFLLEWLLRRERVSVLSHSGWLGRSASIPAIGWIPDFQHVYLSHCFDAGELGRRDREFRRICQYCIAVIVSSQCARADLEKFDAEASTKSYVLPFVSNVASLASSPIPRRELEVKYGYAGNFFLLPNQFWKHKNHLTVIEALGLLRREGKNILVLATGQATDYRHPGHFEGLMTRVKELDVVESFRYLGLVPSSDLAALMCCALAVINPSYFEGWSTSVEEAKALGKRVIVSDIPVHREQAPSYATYFVPNDVRGLADALWAVWKEPMPDERDRVERATRTTAERRVRYARQYQEIVSNLVKPHAS